MIDRFEILASRVRQKLSRTGWTARLLGYDPPRDQSDQPGIVLIQIDGLGEDVLRLALEQGQLPFLRHLLEDEGHQVRSVYTGFPSSTPGFQGELFYGVRTCVPAFGYRDPELGRVISMNDPAAAAAIEERLTRDHPGLLRGGSAWSNIFSGGADEPHLCASTAGLGYALRAIAPNRLLGLLLWHFWSAIRVMANLVFITLFVIGDLITGRLPARAVLGELRFVPLQVAVSAVMREIVTAGATVDAERGLPIIQLNYLGYDEHAHRRGPTSWLARWSLRGIDTSVRRVWLAAHRSRRRDYQFWIYSDHGQEKVVPYRTLHGVNVPEAVETAYQRVLEGGGAASVPSWITRRHLTQDRFEWMGMDTPWWMRTADPSAASRSEAAQEESSDDGPRIEVVNQGPVGFAYLHGPHPIGFEHALARSLVEDEGIPMALTRLDDGRALVYQRSPRRGSDDDRPLIEATLPEDAERVLGPDHPHAKATAEDLLAALHHVGAGHIMLVGWNPVLPLTLQDEHGAHGGPGPRETSAFVLLPPEARELAAGYRDLRPDTLREMILAFRDAHAEPETAIPGEVHSVSGTPPPGAEVTPDAKVIRLRIMTYNVHGCRGMDGKFAPERIARVIDRERPDVVCLQELDHERGRSGGVNQAHIIANRLRAEYHFHAVSEFDDGKFGNAVLSSLPLRLRHSGALPAADRAKALFNLEDRGALWVTLDIDGESVHVLNTHLSLLEQERRMQAHALMGPDWLSHPDCRGAVILAGDFNAAPHSWTLRQFGRLLRSTVGAQDNDRELRTWSGRVPLRRIDHILVSRSVRVRGVYVPRSRLSRVASDHLPLVTDLECRFDHPAVVAWKRDGESGDPLQGL